MVQKRGFKIIGVTLILLLAINSFLYINSGRVSYATISGMDVKEISDLPFNLNLPLLIFICLWIIIIIIGLIAYSRLLKTKKVELNTQDYKIIKEKKSKSETDLDVLYHLLQKKEKLNTKTISMLFKITTEKALEWAKILENHGLVTIDYPTFNHPEVKINGKHENEGENEEIKQETKPAKEIKDKGKQNKNKLKK